MTSNPTVQIYRLSGFNGEDFATVAAKILGLTTRESQLSRYKKIHETKLSEHDHNLRQKLTAFVSELNDVRNKIHIGSNLHDRLRIDSVDMNRIERVGSETYHFENKLD